MLPPGWQGGEKQLTTKKCDHNECLCATCNSTEACENCEKDGYAPMFECDDYDPGDGFPVKL